MGKGEMRDGLKNMIFFSKKYITERRKVCRLWPVVCGVRHRAKIADCKSALNRKSDKIKNEKRHFINRRDKLIYIYREIPYL